MPFRTKNCYEMFFFANNCFKFFCFSLMLFAFLNIYIFCTHFLNISELQSFRSVGSLSCLCIFSHYWSLLVLPCNALITSVDYPWSGQGLVRKSSQGISGLLWNTTLIWKCYTATICSWHKLLIDWISSIDANLLQIWTLIVAQKHQNKADL